MKAITAEMARQADRYAMDVCGIPSLTLMNGASMKVYDHLKKYLETEGGAAAGEAAADETADAPVQRPVIVLAGVGNNGGDGACIASLLLRGGYHPVLWVCGDLERATWEFLYQLSQFKKLGGTVCYYREGDELPQQAVVVDALFGVGLSREVTGRHAALLQAVSASGPAFVLAVDMPSGIHTDTGAVMGTALKADMTVTFGYNKQGLTAEPGRSYAGQIVVENIGIPAEAYRAAGV